MVRFLPNLISLARLLSVPFILRLIHQREYEWALACCLAAGLSDALDGYLARRLHAQSRLGAYLDPVGDKCLLSGIFLVLGLDGVIPWWLTALVFARDAMILAFVGYAMAFTRIRNFAPTVWGKVSTAIQIATALVVLVAQTGTGAGWAGPLESPMVVLTVLGTGWSGVNYSWVAFKMVTTAEPGL